MLKRSLAIFRAAVAAVVDWGIFGLFRPMLLAGVLSLPAVGLGLWLRWDWLASAGFVLGYAVSGWGLFALLFVVAFGRLIGDIHRRGS